MRRIRHALLVILLAASWALPGALYAQGQQAVEVKPPSEAIREASILLAALGYEPGPTDDGAWKGRLSAAYRSFLRDVGLPASEALTPRGLRRLREVARSEGVAGAGASTGTASVPPPDRLHRAVIAGNIDGVRLLLSDGAPVDGRDSQGWTPLMHAASKGYVLLVEMLLGADASPDIRAADGATALFIATMNAHPEAIALLMQAGASVSIRGPRGLTAVDVARLVYGEKKSQRPVPGDAEVRALLGGMTWAEAVEAAVAVLKAKPEDSQRSGSPKQEQAEQQQGLTAPQAAGRTVSPTSSPGNAEAVESALALTRAQRTSVQKALSALGFDAGTADGVFGRRTRGAIRKWQISGEDDPTGHLDASAVAVLLAAEQEARRAERRRRAALAAGADGEGMRTRVLLATEQEARRAAEERDRERQAQAAVEEEERRRKAELTPGRMFRDCPECPEMVVVPAGSFTMGSSPHEEGREDREGPQRLVRIPKPYAVGKYEVTFREWDACVTAGGCNHRPGDEGWGRGRRPTINVSWHDSQEYVRWLSRRTGKPYRLLSEAEWEYAARAGTMTRYYWDDDIGRNRANCDGCGSRWDDDRTAPVGSFAPNDFGLHDMLGNVWEWVEDCWRPNYSGAPSDGSAWVSGEGCGQRILRGGSWYDTRKYVRVAFRSLPMSVSDGREGNVYGFRVARNSEAGHERDAE